MIINTLFKILTVILVASIMISCTEDGERKSTGGVFISKEEAAKHFDRVYRDLVSATPTSCASVEPVPVMVKKSQGDHVAYRKETFSFHEYIYSKEKDINRIQLCSDDVEELRTLMCKQAKFVIDKASIENLERSPSDKFTSGYFLPEHIDYFCEEELADALLSYNKSYKHLKRKSQVNEKGLNK